MKEKPPKNPFQEDRSKQLNRPMTMTQWDKVQPLARSLNKK